VVILSPGGCRRPSRGLVGIVSCLAWTAKPVARFRGSDYRIVRAALR